MKPYSPPVLYFHSVAPGRLEPWTLSFLTMELDRFEDQMKYFQSRGYRSIFLDEWLAIRKGEQKAGPRDICITFDDGLLDNWVYAFPTAKKYGMRLTIFVCPELIDPREVVRPNLDDVWAGRCRESDLVGLGNLSWSELRLMEQSGFVDVQSHTMSHTKYFISGKLTGFYYGGFKGFYPTLNTCGPEEKPWYMNDPDFEKRLPFGTPLFEETSAVTARKSFINPDFIAETALLASKYDLSRPDSRPDYEEKARAIYQRYEQQGILISSVESDDELRARQVYEIAGSKRIMEEKLGKTVPFICWPHGDNNPQAHEIARASGYLATTVGKMLKEHEQPDRIPRFGTDWGSGKWVARRKIFYKMASHRRKQPWYAIWLANEYKNKLLQRT